MFILFPVTHENSSLVGMITFLPYSLRLLSNNLQVRAQCFDQIFRQAFRFPGHSGANMTSGSLDKQFLRLIQNSIRKAQTDSC